jgi:hypothetical protein
MRRLIAMIVLGLAVGYGVGAQSKTMSAPTGCTSRVFPRHPVLGLRVGQLASGTSSAAGEIGGKSHCWAMRS